MSQALFFLIIGVAAGGPAIGLWLYLRRGRHTPILAAEAEFQNSIGGAPELVDAQQDYPAAANDYSQQRASPVLALQQLDGGSIIADSTTYKLVALAPDGDSCEAENAAPIELLDHASEEPSDADETGERTKDAECQAVDHISSDTDAFERERPELVPAATAPLLRFADETQGNVVAELIPVSADVLPPVVEAVSIELGEAAHQIEPSHATDEGQREDLPDLDDLTAVQTHDDSIIEINSSAADAKEMDTEAAVQPDIEVEGETGEPAAITDPRADDSSELFGSGESGATENAGEAMLTRLRPSKPAQHRDRRGHRRAVSPKAGPASAEYSAVDAALRAPAEAKLRLILHPIRRTAALYAILTRPPGYPDHVTAIFGDLQEVGAYDEDRYDDIDLDWTEGLLSAELRLDCKEGYQWLRSSRRIQLFGKLADEQGVVSVGSAALSSPTTIICMREDAASVRAAAEECGSPELEDHENWSGIPDGWTVLSGYRPTRAAASALDTGLTGLDPGVGSEIRFSEGLRIRAASFAECSPPKIEIIPLPTGATVTIDGRPAALGDDNAWRAQGWNEPGEHLVDIVPGPSAAYRILEDPFATCGWETWDAHPERFSGTRAPWALAEICGAAVLSPGGGYVIAAEATMSVVCLGLRSGAATLRGRPDAPVAVGLLMEPPAFLISASGPRRNHGRISWLNPSAPSSSPYGIDVKWVTEVRSAASRRLPLDGGGTPAEDAWRKAKERARRQRRWRS